MFGSQNARLRGKNALRDCVEVTQRAEKIAETSPQVPALRFITETPLQRRDTRASRDGCLRK
jgi:hypothetical protein